MDIFNILTMIGGIAFFMFGMQLMGDGLERAADGKLETMLQKLTSSKLKGVLLGAGITAIIQSSSATSVTLVGFVNSGIMRLSQATPVILGANIGTTATAWLLSLAGIEGENVLIQLLKPSSFSPVLAAIGVVMMMSSKNGRKRDLGTILLGFAVLMTGLDMMSGAAKPLTQVPAFVNLLTMFENPLLGVVAGAVLTGILQSSSASVGILQALSLSGGVSWAAAIPIIMGQNIGACLTVLISGIGANKNARRVTMVHLYFNVVGTIIFMILFVLIKPMFLAFFDQPINIAEIAIVHSMFNILSTLIVMPFLDKLEWLAIKTIPDTETSQERVLIDHRLLQAPSIALGRCNELVRDMAELSKAAAFAAFEQMKAYDLDTAKRIESAESEVDKYEDALGSFLVKMNDRSLSVAEGREVSRILHGIGEFERMSDHALNLNETAAEINDKHISFTPEANVELEVLKSAVKQILNIALEAFENNDLELAQKVEPLEEVIDSMTRELKLRHIARLRAGKCTVETGFVYADLLTNCERIADHCSNLAVCIIELAKNTFNAHEYTKKAGGMEDFVAQYRDAQEQFALPPMQQSEEIAS